MARTLWIIADDYGLGERHDAVMRELLAASSIHAVSVLSESCTPASARALAELWTPGRRVGLHFNLTWSRAGAKPRPGRSLLLVRSAIGLGRSSAGSAFSDQWRRFEDLFGRAPDYIDGHEHCHAYPAVRSVVLDFAGARSVPVRSMAPLEPPNGMKARVIAGLGRAVRRKAHAAGVPTNLLFGGVLPFADPDRAALLLRRELQTARNRAADITDGSEIWVMTHPGDESDPVQIPGHPPRLRSLEADVLSSLPIRPEVEVTSSSGR
jgi:chitin disaccharide deacetylase